MSIFWGKLKQTEPGGQVIAHLSLANHCLDVASVFRELCDIQTTRRSLGLCAGTDFSPEMLDRLAVFALWHDLGKCNWGFQLKQEPKARRTASHIRETIPLFFDPGLAEQFFEAFDCNQLTDWVGSPESVFRLFLASISHHGRPAFTFDDAMNHEVVSMVSLWKTEEGIDPMEGLQELFDTARRAFPAAFRSVTNQIPVTESLQHRFSGLVMLADWLGSHSEAFFPFKHDGLRMEWSRRQAKKALISVGLDSKANSSFLSRRLPSFQEVFGFQPYPLQAHLAGSDLPPLLIAESDTGSGKTEAALIHFLALLAVGQVDSLYFALPTRVAARELYNRVLRTMKKTFGNDSLPVLLAVPGYTLIDGEPPGFLPSEDRLWSEQDQHRRERQWSAERPKRFLAATVAVGTIDQALLSTIRVPHAHLRRVCLDRALLVIDEVHSSDVYMRALSRKMLSEHLRVGGHALLLSATLGSAAREEYLNPATNNPPIAYDQAARLAYPCLSSKNHTYRDLAVPDRSSKFVRIDPVVNLEAPEELIGRLERAMEDGLRVMVVLNTVKRAIVLARTAAANPILAKALFSLNGVPCPHHGRFSKTDREALDQEISHRMGKGSPTGAVLLIGTQTLEQSLDIDADWLITDLCPIDVLLQRIGRLHRHDRGKRPDPVCTILLPIVEDVAEYIRPEGDVSFSAPAGFGTVYEDLRIIQLTRNIVVDAQIFNLPRDNRRLVEAATHPQRLSSLNDERWVKHSQHLEGSIQAMILAAHGALIPDKHFGDFSFPSSLETKLMTRLGLNDRRLLLGEQFPSPFGKIIEELNIPGHMARGLDKEEADSVEVKADSLVIRAGAYTYLYSRFGLEKVDESTNG
jgi:CRISPR-associated endonuclease/helicase Cas3